jgi:hypothetical protein
MSMTHSNNILFDQHESWAEDGATLNPAPTPVSRIKDLRDTAEGCRERATADMVSALAMSTANGRQVFEKSAASWTKRADMLQRIETGIEARLHEPDPDSPELTSAEIAEDAAHLRR